MNGAAGVTTDVGPLGLDGNAIADVLFDAFGEEMTAALGECGGCGWTGHLAELAVYIVRRPGTVARCPRCRHLMLVIVDRRGMICVDVAGFAALGEP